jgi:hypothetical protein
MNIYPVINQVTYPLVGDIDDCTVIATFWAARNAGYTGSLPTVPAFRNAAGEPDVPGANGLTNDQVWRGVEGTILRTLNGTKCEAIWWSYVADVKRGASSSLAVMSRLLPANLRFGFLGPHRIGVAFDGSHLVVANPLAPGGSAPLPCSEESLKLAATGLGVGYVLAVNFPRQERNGMLVISDPTPKTVDVAVGVQLYDLNAEPKIKVSVKQGDIYSPFRSGIYRAVAVTTGGQSQLLLVKASDVTDSRPMSGDVKHTVTLSVDGKVKSTTEV